MSFLTASDFKNHHYIDNDDNDDASFITAASSAYKSTGSIVFELPDEDTQATARNVCSSSVIPVKDNEKSIQFIKNKKYAGRSAGGSSIIDLAKLWRRATTKG